MRTRTVVVLAFCGIFIAPAILAQPPQSQERPGGPARFGPLAQELLGEGWEKRDAQELVEIVMMVRLSKELELSEENTVVMVRRFQEFKERHTELSEKRQAALKALKESVKAEEDDQVVQEKLDTLVGLDRELLTMKQRAFDKVSSELDPVQQAKLYVFLQDFESQMRRLVERARQYRAGPGEMPRGPGRFGTLGGPGRHEGRGGPSRGRREAPGRGPVKPESTPEESPSPEESAP